MITRTGATTGGTALYSPDSVASEVARKEVAFAASLNKRFAPIVCRRVDDTSVPEVPLASLNFVVFDDEVTRCAKFLQRSYRTKSLLDSTCRPIRSI